MVEGGGDVVGEADMLEAIFFAHEAMQPLIDIQLQLQETHGAAKRPYSPPAKDEDLADLLETLGPTPLIVRSSSLLEDNFGTAFAGKYDSIFLPNQGTLEENLKALTQAIARIYASTLNPTALLYRKPQKAHGSTDGI